MAALYRHRDDDDIQEKIIDVFICKLRSKINPLGIEIITHHGECFEMTEASKVRARELMAQIQT